MPENNQPNKKTARRTLTGVVMFILKEIFVQKKWILLPLWVLLAAIGIILLIGGSSSILPAVYIIGF